jgi:hypothetical protein
LVEYDAAPDVELEFPAEIGERLVRSRHHEELRYVSRQVVGPLSEWSEEAYRHTVHMYVRAWRLAEPKDGRKGGPRIVKWCGDLS